MAASKLTSSYSLRNFYFTLIFLTFLVTSILIKISTEFFRNIVTNQHQLFDILIIAFFIFTLIAIYRTYLLRFPKIKITTEGIRFQTLFKTDFFQWSQVEDIKITDRENLSYIISSSSQEATTIKFTNNRKKIIFPNFYRNSPQIREILFIASKLKNENKSFASLFYETEKYDFSVNKFDAINLNINLAELEKFSGNPFACAMGIAIIGVNIAFFWIIQYTPPNSPNLILTNIFRLIFITIITFSFGSQLNYFYLNNNYLVVKNHVWFWRKKIFDLRNITEIVFDQQYRRAKEMIVITKDFRSHKFEADSLREKKWDQLAKKLTELNILTRKE